jgi:hypothetical protein
MRQEIHVFGICDALLELLVWCFDEGVKMREDPDFGTYSMEGVHRSEGSRCQGNVQRASNQQPGCLKNHIRVMVTFCVTSSGLLGQRIFTQYLF